ncbi:sulfotransferase 1B1-like [Glandiceps talaboti]
MEGGNFMVNGFVCFPYFDKEKIEKGVVESFEFRSGDVIVCGFPKSGNTWLVEILKSMYTDWGLCRMGRASEATIVEERSLFKMHPGIRQRVVDTIKHDDLPSPRLLRSHLPTQVFPLHNVRKNGAKVIYISRNPKDVCVSTYHFLSAFRGGVLGVDWEQTVIDFIEDRIPFAPWTQHVLNWYKFGIADNVMHVTYEEMKLDLPRVIKKIAKFLDRPLKDEDVAKVVEMTTIESMRNRFSELLILDDEIYQHGKSPFLRKGVVGDWKHHFTVSQNDMFDEKIGKKIKDKVGIPYE